LKPAKLARPAKLMWLLLQAAASTGSSGLVSRNATSSSPRALLSSAVATKGHLRVHGRLLVQRVIHAGHQCTVLHLDPHRLWLVPKGTCVFMDVCSSNASSTPAMLYDASSGPSSVLACGDKHRLSSSSRVPPTRLAHGMLKQDKRSVGSVGVGAVLASENHVDAIEGLRTTTMDGIREDTAL
jgi:hypothetical protein